MILIRPTQMCWICGKAVSPETFTSDEHGSSVHVRCHAARLALARASLKLSETTLRPHAIRRPVNKVMAFRAEEHRQAS